MKKITISFLSMLLVVNFAYAGGLVTNTNQSAAWSRMLVRDASTSIDAVYFNPAGLTKLADGFYISLSNQSIFQTQTLNISQITSVNYNRTSFTGNISAPVFPDIYMAYRTGKWAFSVGFNAIGGGGSAEFKNGVPMAEVPIAGLVPQFAALGVTGYSMDSYLKGSSAYYGIQAGISYAISPTVSVYVGGRYNIVRNSYTGYLKNISFNTANGSVRADTFMNGIGDQAHAGAADATTASTGLQNWIGAGAGGYTFAQAVAGNAMTSEQAAAFETGLLQLGFSQTQIDALTLSQAQAAFNSAATTLSAEAAQMYAGAKLMADQNLDVKQSGTGFTPIVGANLSFLNNNLDIGIKYEFKTKLTITNNTAIDSKTGMQEGFIMGLDKTTGNPVYMFPNGVKTNADIPSYLSVGVRYNLGKVVSLQAGYHLYGDRGTGWTNVNTTVGKDYQEYGLGAEFHVSPKLLLSGGYLYSASGVNAAYQSDLSYSLSANTIGLGGAYKISDMVTLQLGAYKVYYAPKTYDEVATSGAEYVGYNEEYLKSTWALAVGLDFSFGNKHKK